MFMTPVLLLFRRSLATLTGTFLQSEAALEQFTVLHSECDLLSNLASNKNVYNKST